jgi:hypothetical protein
MTLRESLGGDVRRVHEQVDALLDREDGIVALFDGGRVVTYAQGFGASASQLEFLGVELERALRLVVGRPIRKGRRRRERDQGDRRGADVNGDRHRAARGVLQLADKIA